MALQTAAQSLRQQLFRAILSVLGIVCGVTAVFALICISEGARDATLAQIEQLGIRNIIIRNHRLNAAQKVQSISNLSSGLTMDDLHHLRQRIPALDGGSALHTVVATISGLPNGASAQVALVTPSYQKIEKLILQRGRFFSLRDLQEKNQVAVLGDQLAHALSNGSGRMTSVRVGNSSFKVIGVLASRNVLGKKKQAIAQRNVNTMALFPLGLQLTAASNNSVDEIVLRVREQRQVLALGKVIRRELLRLHHGVEDFSLIVPMELLNNAQQTQRTFNIVLGAIASISLLVGGIGIMNIMLATVSERRREIGIRRAVGANQWHILIQFLSEAILLTVTGGILGILGGLIFVWGIASYAEWTVTIPLWAVMVSLLMALCVGLFSGLYPAYRAAKIDPIAALRYE